MERNLILMAAHKAVSEAAFKTLSQNLEPGNYPVDCTVRIVGSLKKGKPVTQTYAAAADPWKVLAVALSKLNAATREAVIRDSLTISDKDATVLKAQADDLIQKLVQPTERTRTGNVSAILAVEVVGEVVENNKCEVVDLA